jgi:2,5-diamino-6-(ribosylamino)-4(3H)-pyrimidinone 5'-phosphate reductase
MHQKPYIICHMMATIDGKITSGTDVDILDNYFDLYTKTEDQLEANSWMLGRVTMEMFAKGQRIPLPESAVISEDFTDEKSEKGYMVGIDIKGTLRWDKNTIKLSNYPHELPIIIIVTKETPSEYLAYLKDLKINYIFAGDKEVNLHKAFDKLVSTFGIKRILLEGGGKINGSVMAEDLVDEISLMIVPQVLNKSDAPTIFERTTEIVDTKQFNLSSVTQIEKDCVWLRYSRN